MNIMLNIIKSTKFKRLKQYLWDFFINGILSMYLCPLSLRMILLPIVGIKCKKAVIHAKCYIGSKKLIIGENSYINREVLINNDVYVKIGDKCAIGYRVSFYTTNHLIESKYKRAGKCINKEIVIGNGCWIGANSILLPGVNIGNGVVIASGSVVNKDCESNYLYAGVPAKKIKLLK